MTSRRTLAIAIVSLVLVALAAATSRWGAGVRADFSVTHDLPASIDVPLTTIDRVVRELGLAHVDFIKLDIENAEASALRGAAETLATYQPRVAVALENAKDRLGYADEIIQILQRASDDYSYSCTNPVRGGQILPEILHFDTH